MNENQSRGGKARAKNLSPDERKEIARKAANSRWNAEVPMAEFEGTFNLGNSDISAAVLPDGRRLVTQSTFLRALGRSRSPKAGTGVLSTVDGLPFFLQADALKPFITEDLARSTAPIFFIDKAGKKAVGYNAELLPAVAEVYLKLRDESESIPKQYEHIIKACDLLIRGLARVGIIALVDEATGYQTIRDKDALQSILDKFLAKELAAWAKRFPDDFYKEIFRLRKWTWKGMKVNKPQVVAKYTNDIVYERLAPGILEELERKNPSDGKGNRKARHHQWLTDDVGHPALAQHLHAVIGIMRGHTDWDSFKRFLDKAFPKRGSTLLLPMDLD